MSSPHREPENAAPAVPLSRPRSTSAAESGRAGGAEATYPTAHRPLPLPQSPPQEQPQPQQQTQTQQPSGEQQPHIQTPLPPSDHATPPPAPGDTGPSLSHGSGSGSNSTSTASLSVKDDKKTRASSSSQRSTGPSLLTQALATARGIPKQQAQTPSSSSQPTTEPSPSPLPSTSTSNQQPLDIPAATPPERTSTAQASTSDKARDAPAQYGDKPPLKPRPRPSPLPSNMAAWTATAPSIPSVAGRDASGISSGFNPASTTDVRDMLLEHRGASDNLIRRSSASLDIERKAFSAFDKARAYSYSTSPDDLSTTPTNLGYLTGEAPTAPSAGDDTASESWSRSRPINNRQTLDHFSMGSEKTEKIWSIGSGEGAEPDGLVEQSVTEAMAGLEHNARSRKASYSLRFFKEGLPPEDKPRRRDTKGGARDKSVTRERLSSMMEEKDQPSQPKIPSDDAPADREAHDVTESAKPRSRTAPSTSLPSPGSPGVVEHQAEYFSRGHDDATNQTKKSGRIASQQVTGHEAKEPMSQAAEAEVGPSRLPVAEPESPQSVGVEGRRESGGSTEVGEHDGDPDADADESGEEKISSAVFVPHQELAEARPRVHDPTDLAAAQGQRPRSLSEDESHPWLVKADEPEPKLVDKEEERAGRLSHFRSRESLVSARGEAPSELSEDFAVEGDHEISNQLAQVLARTGVQPFEDHVHDHQSHISQPLDAIELIPYKHQVGGHTTLWRFSRRAVCKQLNNRENEFYEIIERYHRDLLSFLPRYIGVLNVTFQKQPRRKSTTKKDEAAAAERQKIKDAIADGVKREREASDASKRVGTNGGRVVSHSLANNSSNFQIPTVTFDNNRHILPRNLLQPTPSPSPESVRRRSLSGARTSSTSAVLQHPRPPMDERPNSWGATTVNKRLRNEVFNDAFLKEPVEVHKHRPPHQRSIPRPTLQRLLRTSNSESNLANGLNDMQMSVDAKAESLTPPPPTLHGHTQSDLGPDMEFLQPQRRTDTCGEGKDLSGTSAPEPQTLKNSPLATKRKRRYSAGGLRRKPTDVQEARGDLKYFEEADDAGYKGDSETISAEELRRLHEEDGRIIATTDGAADHEPLPHDASRDPFPPPDFTKVPRPINPKEAKTQQDRVEYFLLLEDLTAGMKRPCMMDLKMGTRQYGADATPKKQKSQKAKCQATTSAELGVRICGLQVWNAKTQSYEFQDKYFGRRLKAGAEFQAALQKFLYNGVELQSVLRHIPVVLNKLARLEQIAQKLRGYRFYAASLLMFYDGDTSEEPADYDTAYDSMTDAATDTEEMSRNKKRNRREIDFKMADFANSLTPLDRIKDQDCPPRHPDAPDVGFLKGLRSLRRYFLQIQSDVRAELGLGIRAKHYGQAMDGIDGLEEEIDEGMISL